MVLKIESVIEEKGTGYNPQYIYCESDVPIVVSSVLKSHVSPDDMCACETRSWIPSARLAIGSKDGKQWRALFDGYAWMLENGKTIESFKDYAGYGEMPSDYLIPVFG